MNNEPVAWIKQNPETLEAELHFDKPAKYWATVVSNPDIPLYTRPANTYQSITDTKIEPTVVSYTHPVKEDAQYDKGFDAGVKHGKTIYQAEIEALKEALQAVITISDRKHDAWDKAKELLK